MPPARLLLLLLLLLLLRGGGQPASEGPKGSFWDPNLYKKWSQKGHFWRGFWSKKVTFGSKSTLLSSNGAKMVQNRPKGFLSGSFWSPFGTLSAAKRVIFGYFGLKWTLLGQNCSKIGPKMSPRRPKRSILTKNGPGLDRKRTFWDRKVTKMSPRGRWKGPKCEFWVQKWRIFDHKWHPESLHYYVVSWNGRSKSLLFYVVSTDAPLTDIVFYVVCGRGLAKSMHFNVLSWKHKTRSLHFNVLFCMP